MAEARRLSQARGPIESRSRSKDQFCSLRSKACARRAPGKQWRRPKLAAILAADVVGYSRLMGKEQRGRLACGSIARRRGRSWRVSAAIVKTTATGYCSIPSVVVAVEGAISIQKLIVERNAGTPEAKRIVYRISVNLGDVLIEGDEVLGDSVDIAARWKASASPAPR